MFGLNWINGRYYKYRNPIVLCEYIESISNMEQPEKKFYLFIDEVQLTTKVVDQGKRRYRGHDL